jgi:drug/metabolite transporter (DMT)-like permease
MSKALSSRTVCLTSLAMLAFAGNSLLCRLALKTTSIDAISFTSLRLVAGALMLWLLLRWRNGGGQLRGNWRSAAALFTYAAAFSLAYLHLDAGTGALLLFGAVQTSMLLQGVLQGERPDRAQLLGFVLALGGLLALLLPGASAPDRDSALLMLLAGVAWGLYSLLGRGTREPLAASAGNFLRTLPFVAVLLLAYWPDVQGNALGVLYAVLSGALTSGLGYFIWYSALPGLSAFQAASVQLSVPILAALAGSLLLSESISLRLLLASLAVLGGIGLILRARVGTPRG